MKKALLAPKPFKAILLAVGLLFTSVVFAQTIIANGQTVDASDIPVNTNVRINAGGTLNMDVSRTFLNVTTAIAGTSTISGTGELTASNSVSLAGANTLSVAPSLTTPNLITVNLNNQTATVSGLGSIDAGTIRINGANNSDATLTIASGLTVQAGNITGGNGTGTNHNLSLSGILQISGTVLGLEELDANTGSTVSFNGGNQTVFSTTYFNLTLAGTGTKSLGGDRAITGNFLLENGTNLSLGNNNLTIAVSGGRTATINGRLNINGNGRLLETGGSIKTLNVGETGYISITDIGGTSLGSISLNDVNLNATSTVEYGATDDQIITDVPAPGYGHLVISGDNTKTAGSNLDIQGDLIMEAAEFDAEDNTHNIKGNWVRNGGTFSMQDDGEIVFSGTAPQSIGGSLGTIFSDITFANTGGGLALLAPTTVTDSATFTNGIVTSDPTNVLIFNDGATSSLLATNASTPSFVNGPVRKVGNEAFLFPIGAATGFVPLAISAPSNPLDAFTAQYFRGVPVDNTDITAPGISHISACDFWELEETNDQGNNNNINITFYWNANNPCGGSAYVTVPGTVKAVQYAGGSWSVASAAMGSAGSTAASGNVVFAARTTFGPFTLASTNPLDNPLPVVFADVKAYEKNSGVQIEWSNLTEKDVAEYTIERSADGRDFSAIGQQLPTSNQNDKASYSAFDVAPAQGFNYYRIKAEETTGKIIYSKILSVSLGKETQSLRLYPNPVRGNQVNISLSNVRRGQYDIRVINTAGQDVYKLRIISQGSSIAQTLDLPAFVKPGVYNMVVTGDGYRESKMFIVQ